MRPRSIFAFNLTACLPLVCLLFLPCICNAEQLPVKSYTVADGLAQNLVLKIVPDSRGYLWFCTAEGLSRFDGYSFKNYTTADGLPHRSVRDLLETRQGVYWLATGDGLVRFDPAARTRNPAKPLFVVYRPGENFNARSIRRIYEDRDGTVWLGTERGVFRIEGQGDAPKLVQVELGMPADCLVEDILLDRRGTLWIGTREHGLYRRLPNGHVENYGMKHGLPSKRMNSLLEDKRGRLWVGASGGLSLLKDEPNQNEQIVSRVYKKDAFGIPSDWVEALFQTSDGRLWVGLSGGLSELLPGESGGDDKFRTFTGAHGLDYLDQTSLAEDSASNLWIGATGGAMKLARKGFVTYTDRLSPFGIGDIIESKSGEVCFIAGNQSRGIYILRYSDTGLSTVNPNFTKRLRNSGWGWNQIVLRDHAGEWWIATGEGLYRFPKVNSVDDLAHVKPKAVYTTKDGLIDDSPWRIFEDSRGDIWLATAQPDWSGVTRWERSTEKFHHYTGVPGLPSTGWAAAFEEDVAGNVWIGMGAILVRYTNGNFRSFAGAEGAPSGTINSLYRDSLGRLWIASDTSGVGRIDNPEIDSPRFTNYTTANGLSSNQVFSVVTDELGNVYAFNGRGLDYLNLSNNKIIHYSMSDGLVGGAPKSMYRDSHGILWLGTDLGLSKFIPGPDSPTRTLSILVSSLRIGGEPKPMSELGETDIPELRLGPNENQVQIDFVGLNFAAGEQLKYQYRLEGTDADWSAPTDQRSVNFVRLSPGSYRFVVRAVGTDGTISETPARVAFVILPPVWKRWWFLTIVAAGVVLLTYFAYRYRVSRLLELERVRTRIATDLHDDIGSNLSLIAMVSEVANRGTSPDDSRMTAWLNLIANTSRETVDSMSDIVWAINPAKDRLLELTQRMRRVAEDMLGARNIQLQFITMNKNDDQYLGADTRRELFMIFKEALNNVARHSGCSAVEVVVNAGDSRLQLNLKDNGKGFDLEDLVPGNGLSSMRRRAQNLKAHLSINSKPGDGTTVSLSLPLRG